MPQSSPPDSLYDLIEDLRLLPGVGRKTATRYAYWLVSQDQSYLSKLSQKIKTIKHIVKVCQICGNKSEYEVCSICNDSKRVSNQICIVEQAEDILPFEKTGIYQGVYHVLGGLVDPLQKQSLQELSLESLMKRIPKDEPIEIIIALNPNLHGELTTQQLREQLGSHMCKVTVLGRGISMGTTLEYIDNETLQHALRNRK